MERPQPDRDDGRAAPERRSATADALRLLARRPRTRPELEHELERLAHGREAIEEALEAAAAAGYLDHAALASHYIAARADRLGHGPARLIGDLERRGLSREEAERAWRTALEHGDVIPVELLRRAIRRRLKGRSTLDSKGYSRVYNALLRAGYDGNDVRSELEPFRAAVDPFNSIVDDGTNDDFP